MDTLIYLLKTGLIYSILFGIYFLLFRKNTNFQANRIYLLVIIPFSFILPLINANISLDTQYQITLPVYEVGNSISNTNLNNIDSILPYLYGIISMLLLLVFTFNLFKTVNTIASIKKGENNNIQPFSFFSFIHVPTNIEKEDRDAIILHEKVHSEQFHSFDIMLYEISKIILWWNPFIWVGLKSIKSNHEFIADKLASVKADKYSSVLVAQLLGVNCSVLANNFKSNQLLKKRIMMMKTKKSNKLSLVKYALAVPVVALTLMVTAQNNETGTFIANTNNIAEAPITPHSPPKAPKLTGDKIDIQPQFKGGMEALAKYMGDHINYPKEAKKENIEGKVFIAFIVDANGNIKEPKVVKSAHKLLDAEAIRVVKSMPKWNPGKKDGKNVKAKVTLPISFKNN
ncbi:MAG: M56 family metallopeptidase [Vicingaceae bacterium]